MSDNYLTKLINTFLIRNYPITKIKVDGRFRRGVMLDGIGYPLSNVKTYITLENKLINILNLVFYCNTKFSQPIIRNFLNKKN